jgi:hypothetical protein
MDEKTEPGIAPPFHPGIVLGLCLELGKEAQRRKSGKEHKSTKNLLKNFSSHN